MNDIITAISTVGFPIVACLGLGYFCYTITNKMLEVIQTNTEALASMKEELHHLANKNEE